MAKAVLAKKTIVPTHSPPHPSRYNDEPEALSLLQDIEDIEPLVAGTFKRWSLSAVECYVRKAQCEGCYYQHFFSSRPYSCKMHLAVEQLRETLGDPNPNLLSKFA